MDQETTTKPDEGIRNPEFAQRLFSLTKVNYLRLFDPWVTVKQGACVYWAIAVQESMNQMGLGNYSMIQGGSAWWHAADDGHPDGVLTYGYEFTEGSTVMPLSEDGKIKHMPEIHAWNLIVHPLIGVKVFDASAHLQPERAKLRDIEWDTDNFDLGPFVYFDASDEMDQSKYYPHPEAIAFLYRVVKDTYHSMQTTPYDQPFWTFPPVWLDKGITQEEWEKM